MDFNFNINDLPKSEYGPIEPGVYEADIEEASIKDAKSGGGKYLALKHRIVGPSNANRVIYDNLNIRHVNPSVEEIARRQLGELMAACGLAATKDPQDFVGKRVKIKISLNKDGENRISSYKSAGPQMPPIGTFTAQQPTAPDVAKPAATKAPWMK